MCRSVVLLISLWTTSVFCCLAAAQQIAAPRSVWDGVFTEEQARRGRAVYEKNCSECHGSDLRGDVSSYTPPLAAREFMSKWNGETVGDIFARIQSTPHSDGDAVPLQAKIDILAFMLSFNHFPAGNTELAQVTAQLSEIKFEATKR